MNHEIHKELIDLALASGKALKGEETHFLHYYYGKTVPPHQAIPTIENFLFALAECRTKTVDGVQDGKALITHLLAYQQPSGLFPVYLHDIPYCQDRYIGVHLLPILYHLYHYFHTVLGDVAETIQESSFKLLDATLPFLEQMPEHLQLKCAGSLIAFGKLWDFKQWTQAGGMILPKFSEFLESPSRYIPSHLADVMVGLNLTESDEKQKLAKWMGSLWNSHLECYAGPFQDMHFYHGEQQITLYDLYMAHYTKKIPARIHAPKPVLLQGALIVPDHVEMEIPQAKNLATLNEVGSRGLYPFVYQWGEAKDPRAFIVHPANGSAFKVEGNTMHVKLAELPNFEDKEAAREISTYLPLRDDIKITVNGLAANTFRPGDLIKITDLFVTLEVTFKASEGTFQGHITRGCLPTEWTNFGKERFAAYQWMIFLRTINRPADCMIDISFKYGVNKT